MKTTRRLFPLTILLSVLLLAAPPPASASPSQARIVRLSFVQGEVSFARSATSDPLADQRIVWEAAIVNLPIRQGYVLATLQGRAEVEFESGATAYLAENSVLEFFDLSLDDGARVTRLVLRQGAASFSVQPARGDFFSVTGADFTAQSAGRSFFRMENFDDASTIGVRKGRVKVVAKTLTSELNSGESVTFGPDAASIPPAGQLPAKDEFDTWVSRRADAANTATASSLTYVSSPYYSSGFADLYSYGGWFPYAGFGYGWRPSGVGLGWSPFSTGSWLFDPSMGWTWVSYEPWGWVPYHFGSWIFAPSYGWVWVPSGFTAGGAPPAWRPATAVWVHSAGTTGIVPLHPLDARGKPPINLAQGVIGTTGVPIRSVEQSSGNARTTWKVLKSPPQNVVSPAITHGVPPVRVSRTLAASGVVQGDQGSSMVTARSSRATPPPPAPMRNYSPPPPPRTSSRSSAGNRSASSPGRTSPSNRPAPRSGSAAPRSSSPAHSSPSSSHPH